MCFIAILTLGLCSRYQNTICVNSYLPTFLRRGFEFAGKVSRYGTQLEQKLDEEHKNQQQSTFTVAVAQAGFKNKIRNKETAIDASSQSIPYIDETESEHNPSIELADEVDQTNSTAKSKTNVTGRKKEKFKMKKALSIAVTYKLFYQDSLASVSEDEFDGRTLSQRTHGYIRQEKMDKLR